MTFQVKGNFTLRANKSITAKQTSFSVLGLFANNEAGIWLDPSDIILDWRKNLITQSENFADSSWAIISGFSAKVSTSVTDPLGGTTACEISYLNANGSLSKQSISGAMVIGQQYTFSIWARRNSGSNQLNFGTNTGLVLGNFIPSSTWQRYSVTFTYAGSWIHIMLADPNASGWTNVQYWGAQLESGSTVTSYQKITDGFQDYYDYKSQPVMFQDSGGSIPVSGLEQPVGLLLDKSKGLTLGPELVTNGNFSNGSTGWTATNADVTVSGGIVTVTNTGNYGKISQDFPVTAGKSYRFTYTRISGIPLLNLSGTFGTPSFASNDAASTVYFTATSSFTLRIQIGNLTGGIGTSCSFDNVSVREVPGNHAYQSTAAARPVLSARYNLLTWTEGFSTSDWLKLNVGSGNVTSDVTAAPDGMLTADKLHVNTTNGAHGVYRSGTVLANAIGRLSVCAKAAELSWIAITDTQGNGSYFNISAGSVGSYIGAGNSATIVSLGNGWFRCTVLTPAIANGSYGVYVANGDGGISFAGTNNSDGVFIWGADFRAANDGAGLPAYQRVRAATYGTSTTAGIADYDTVGFPVYLRFDGVDDHLLGPNISNLITTTEYEACVGARFNSVTTNTSSWLNQSLITDLGGFVGIGAARTTGVIGAYNFDGLQDEANVPMIAPETFVFQQRHAGGNIFASTNRGIEASTASGNTGNIATVMQIFKAYTSVYTNGRLYGIIMRSTAFKPAERISIRNWMNTKTKAY